MTKPCSTVDDFCRIRLQPFNLHDKNENPFFFENHGELYVARNLTADVLFTEDIDIKQMLSQVERYIENIAVIEKWSTKPIWLRSIQFIISATFR